MDVKFPFKFTHTEKYRAPLRQPLMPTRTVAVQLRYHSFIPTITSATGIEDWTRHAWLSGNAITGPYHTKDGTDIFWRKHSGHFRRKQNEQVITRWAASHIWQSVHTLLVHFVYDGSGQNICFRIQYVSFRPWCSEDLSFLQVFWHYSVTHVVIGHEDPWPPSPSFSIFCYPWQLSVTQWICLHAFGCLSSIYTIVPPIPLSPERSPATYSSI